MDDKLNDWMAVLTARKDVVVVDLSSLQERGV
jgi:hypothetical protein